MPKVFSGPKPALAKSSALPAFSETEADIRHQLGKGNFKFALDRAKDAHKIYATPASEALLLDAYLARIQDLMRHNLVVEAGSLRDLVRERFPSAAARLAGLDACLAARSGKLNELAAPLADPALPPERRAAIEKAIERDVTDLPLLADCEALPAEHPLRQAAAALHKAFIAVTSGPVTDDVLELPEVSRRSPLGPWKMLLRAIAAFHRREDETCRQYLAAINPESAPARLVPTIGALLNPEPSELHGAAAQLRLRVMGDSRAWKRALEDLDHAFSEGSDRLVTQAIRAALRECLQTAPGLLDRLKQYICIHLSLGPFDSGRPAGPETDSLVFDSHYFRVFARATEQSAEDPGDHLAACVLWNRFREEAIKEGLLQEKSPEIAALYLHMANLLEDVPESAVSKIEKLAREQGKDPGDGHFYHYPQKLYERACMIEPRPEAFRQWLNWAKRGTAMTSEPVAELWHRMLPRDLEPVLFLMAGYESRNAFPTALQYLNKAESIDSLNPEVRRARLKLMTASVLRSLKQNDARKAEQRIDEMSKLPQAQQGDRPAFLAALRFAAAMIRVDYTAGGTIRRELEQMLGSQAAAALLISSVTGSLKGPEPLPSVFKLPRPERAALPATMARLWLLGRDMQFDIRSTWEWMSETEKQFAKNAHSLDAAQLSALGEVALTAGASPQLAYAVSAAGFGRGNATLAEFLFIRARCLPKHCFDRGMACATAAAELARERGDMELVSRAVGFMRATLPDGSIKLSPADVTEVIEVERKRPKYPNANERSPKYSFLTSTEFCDCPACRKSREEPFSFLDDDADDFDDSEDDDDDDIPLEIQLFLAEETRKAVEKGESLQSLIERLQRMGFPAPQRTDRGRARGGKKRRK